MFFSALSSAEIIKGPYIQKGSTEGVTICWESDSAVPATVGIARVSSEKNWKLTPVNEGGDFHEVRIEGLEPGTEYDYYVQETGGKQEAGRFKTFPGNPEPFRFIAYGDCRSQHDIHRRIVAHMLKFEPEFIVNSGDLVADGTKQEDWDVFWDIIGPLARNVYYYPVLGNHEKDSPLYYKYFSLPDNGDKERYYSFVYSNVLVAALDSNMPYFLVAKQKSWLKDELKRFRTGVFKIVAYHHPFYSSSKREPNMHFRQYYSSTYWKYGVQVAINGHDHFYERSIDQGGVQHIVAGGGGAPLYDQPRLQPETRVKAKEYHFMVFDVTEKRMRVRVVNIDGIVIDEFNVPVK